MSSWTSFRLNFLLNPINFDVFVLLLLQPPAKGVLLDTRARPTSASNHYLTFLFTFPSDASVPCTLGKH